MHEPRVKPADLEEFLQPTPSSVAKLVAAWDGLTDETKIGVIQARSDGSLGFSTPALAKALSDKSPFIRYLAVKSFYVIDELKHKVSSDASPLVRLLNKSSERPPLFTTGLGRRHFCHLLRKHVSYL